MKVKIKMAHIQSQKCKETNCDSYFGSMLTEVNYEDNSQY